MKTVEKLDLVITNQIYFGKLPIAQVESQRGLQEEMLIVLG